VFKNKLHLTVNDWVIVLFIFCIPIVNFIFLLIWAIDRNTNIALRNLSRGLIKFNFICLIILIGIMVALGGKFSSLVNKSSLLNNQSVLTSKFSPITTSENKITFNNVIVENNMGISSVSGEVTNSDTKPHAFSLIVSFYDENQKMIGTAIGTVTNIDAGSTKAFNAISTSNVSNAKKYKVSVDSMLY
jgi:hypothetical protein